MIEELTEEQQSKFEEYAQKWLEIGLSTAEIDVEESRKALRTAYEQVDLTFPDAYEVYDSPFAAIAAMKEKYGITVSAGDFIYGSHEAPWLSFYNYYLEVCDLKECERLVPFMDLAKHCGWALLFDELVVLVQNPCAIKTDEQDRTHCDNDLAIKFRDGTGVAMWHGLRIPGEWVKDKSTITPEVLLQWDNTEQRRAACEIVGWAKVLELLDARVIDEDPEETVGTLLEVDIPDIGVERFLVAMDPNVGRKVGLPVPAEMKTALEANSWTYGIDKVEFKPDFRV